MVTLLSRTRTAFLLALCWSGLALTASTREVRLKLSAGFPKGIRSYDMLESAAKTVQARTESRVVVELIPETAMGQDPLPKVESGELAGAIVPTAMLATRSQTASLLGLPMLATSFDEANAIDAEFAKSIEQELGKSGLEAMAHATMGFAVLLSQTPILAPSDLATHRLFSPNQPGSRFDFGLFGATAVPLLFDEVEAKLKVGKEKGEGGIDCVIGLPDIAILKQWHRHLRHQLETPIFVIDVRLVMSQKALAEVSEGDRAIAKAAFAEGFVQIERDRQERAPSYRRVLERAGFTMNAPAPEQAAAWEEWRTKTWALLGKSLELDAERLAQLEAARARAKAAAGKKS